MLVCSILLSTLRKRAGAVVCAHYVRRPVALVVLVALVVPVALIVPVACSYFPGAAVALFAAVRCSILGKRQPLPLSPRCLQYIFRPCLWQRNPPAVIF